MISKCQSCLRRGGRNSSYLRKSDGKKVIQYRCVRCRRTWTPAADNPEKRQRWRSGNEILRRLLVSGITMERAAWILRINPKTVDRRVRYLAQIADQELASRQKIVRPKEKGGRFYLDELITFEHTRCKPLAVCMVVSQEREILAFRVSSMPPIGKHLKKISLRKYGMRPNHRRKGIEECLKEIHPRLTRLYETLEFKTDEEKSYAQLIQKCFPGAKHQAYPSKRAVIAGLGELKDHSYDPIFPINHTLAMLRANLARLIRRTWSTTKKMSRLRDFLAIYAHAHNTLFIPQES